MPFLQDRVKPTPYPRLPFHSIRSAQLLSSTIVASIMIYFCSELARNKYKLPWTFILLFTVSLLTIFALAATIGLHCFYGLNAALNTALNTSLAVLWGVSFALLSWWSAGTLAHECNVGSWESDTGVSVCRLYKALFSFALLGLASTVFALVLDVRVQRSATNRGQFQQLDTLGDGGKREGHVRDYAGESGGTTVPAMRGERDRDGRGGEGYALPEEQFAYDESYAYTGSAGRVGRRSLDGRL